MPRRDKNAHATLATGHPLPLPPGATTTTTTTTTTTPQPPSSPQINSRHDSMPRIQSPWQNGKLIGRGTFGRVYVGSNRETGALYAMKEVELLLDDPKCEIDVLNQLKHPNIVQYYDCEIVHPGPVNKYGHDHCGGMIEPIVRNIVSGLAYLHSTRTKHRDIKGANLLIDINGVVKLADFGMAKHLIEQTGYLSLKGSPYWMAPELLQLEKEKDGNSDLALAVDIWCLSCTIIEVIDGKPPWSEYEGPAAMTMFKVMKENPLIPENLSLEGKDFLNGCFTRNPAERPSARMLLEHEFLKNSKESHVSYMWMDKEHLHCELDRLWLLRIRLPHKGK
ncbi:unnamed protein product [Lactuca virosa]|uniref:mitogen-activated protein kinase kinase kinase n=1 Tax=Lactuca virosa TaxID=75947 RepID=A0AAU9NI58_9ASTR|nr:unnamed protein product [Lactuca virosa]